MPKTILIVDDFRSIRAIVSTALKRNHFEMLEADSADEAIKVLESDNVDLILSDYNMPGMNGYEFLKYVRASPKFKNIPFILLTSEVDQTKMQLTKEAGLDAWIKKPYKLDHFINTLNYCLEKRSKDE